MAFFDIFKRAAKRIARPFRIFKISAMELDNIQCIAVTAMFIALDLAIKSLSITVIPNLKISFAFLAKASVGMIYGPTVGFIEGFLSDIIGYLIKPTGAFSPLFTLVEALSPMIFGLFLYNLKLSRKEIRDKSLQKQNFKAFVKIVLAKLTVVVICNLILTPIALIISNSMEAGQFVYGSVLTDYPKRLIKNAIQYPVDCVMLIAVLPIVSTAYSAVFKRNKKLSERKENLE